MKLWTTEIWAYRMGKKELRKWQGPNVPGIDIADAQRYCNENGLGYCRVVSELIAEVDEETGDRVDYDNLN